MRHSGQRHLVSMSLIATAMLVAAGCGGSSADNSGTTATTAPASTGSPTTAAAVASAAAPCGQATAPPKRYQHVVVVMEENRTWTGGRTAAVGMGFSPQKMPFLHELATRCSYYTDWSETEATQNSLNQYVGLTSGVVNPSTVNDCQPSDSCHSEDDNLFRQVRAAGGTPRTFVDGATEPCSTGTNKAKHIPALYYWGGEDRSFCAAEVRPLAELDADHLPTLAFVVPDQCHDGHDCDDTKVDDWARTTLTAVLDGASYRAGRTLVVVVYDEDQPVPNLLVAPTARAGPVNTVAGSHAALLKTVEEVLGLPELAQGQVPAAVSLRSSSHL